MHEKPLASQPSNVVKISEHYIYLLTSFTKSSSSLLSVVGKLFGRVLIKRVRAGTECATGEKQCGFRQGRGCIDQVFAIRQVCEKYLANGKDNSGRLWIWKRHMIRSIGTTCGIS